MTKHSMIYVHIVYSIYAFEILTKTDLWLVEFIENITTYLVLFSKFFKNL